MKAHVVCCNDSIEAVVIDDINKAIMHKQALSAKHAKHWNDCDDDNLTEYYNKYFWHIHTVDVLE